MELEKIGIHSLGTVRRNRLRGCVFSSEKELKAKGRGTFEEKTTVVDNIKLRATVWLDNRAVTLLTTFVPANPAQQVERYDRKHKAIVQVRCPSVVPYYNASMGGVDLVDSLLARYRIQIKSRKWYFRLFIHLLDVVMVQCWLLYRRDADSVGIQKKEQLNLRQFKFDAATCLVMNGDLTKKKVGRPSSLDGIETVAKRRKLVHAAALPPPNIRKDGVGHWPDMVDTRGLCRNGGCKGKPYIICTKCSTGSTTPIYLFLKKGQNCFQQYHLQ